MKEEDRKLWTDRINDYRSSGLTAVKWAEDRGIAVHKLRYYINKFNKEKKQNSNQKPKEIQWTSVVPVETKVENKSNNPLKITIGKATVEVASGFDEVTFQSVIRILSQC
ncbi:MAG: hypothetical protein GX962_09800 [Epulopiscium sp.]|nr:hypothetical protein [Candidatus Epulonipiscium sp.]